MPARASQRSNANRSRDDTGALYRWWLLFIVLLIACGLYVALSSASLPAVVASHFDGAGRANATASRDEYRAFMTAFVVLLPLFVSVVFAITCRIPGSLINLPNRDYWLAPEREAETRGVLMKYGFLIAGSLAVFLVVLHALILHANKQIAPELSGLWLAMSLYVCFTGGLLFALVRRFAKRIVK